MDREGNISSRRSLCDDIKWEAKCLLLKHGFKEPVKFRLVLLKGLKGFPAKMAMIKKEKCTVVLKDFKILLLLLKSSRKGKK